MLKDAQGVYQERKDLKGLREPGGSPMSCTITGLPGEGYLPVSPLPLKSVGRRGLSG